MAGADVGVGAAVGHELRPVRGRADPEEKNNRSSTGHGPDGPHDRAARARAAAVVDLHRSPARSPAVRDGRQLRTPAAVERAGRPGGAGDGTRGRPATRRPSAAIRAQGRAADGVLGRPPIGRQALAPERAWRPRPPTSENARRSATTALGQDGDDARSSDRGHRERQHGRQQHGARERRPGVRRRWGPAHQPDDRTVRASGGRPRRGDRREAGDLDLLLACAAWSSRLVSTAARRRCPWS